VTISASSIESARIESLTTFLFLFTSTQSFLQFVVFRFVSANLVYLLILPSRSEALVYIVQCAGLPQ
jgi:hypothetical protein